MAHTVALVLSADSIALFERLARDIPVWVADTPEHLSFKDTLRQGEERPRVTWFPLREGEELERAAIRIIFSLDQHYDELSQEIGYEALWVVGVPCKPTYLTEIEQLGFVSVQPVLGGFLAMK